MRNATKLKLVLFLAVAVFYWTLVEMAVRELGLAMFLLSAAGIIFCVVSGVYALRAAGRAIERNTQPPLKPPPQYQLSEDEISKMGSVNQAFMRERIEKAKGSSPGAS